MPLYLKDGREIAGVFKHDKSSSETLTPNIAEDVLARLRSLYADFATPENIIAYVYAVLYSLAYRSRYLESLKADFPRIPWAGDHRLFCDLAGLGQQLINLHLMRSSELDHPISQFCGKGDGAVTTVDYDAERGHVTISPTQYFDGVSPTTWIYQIGGYQVLQKWLKDRGPKGGRPGHVLSPDDILHYRKIVTAIAKTIELQAEVDRVIAAAGGFPAAFAPAAASRWATDRRSTSWLGMKRAFSDRSSVHTVARPV
jgi:hypothetical protein